MLSSAFSLCIADFLFFYESDCRWNCIAVVLGLSVSHLCWINLIIQVAGLSFVQSKVVVMTSSLLQDLRALGRPSIVITPIFILLLG